MNESPRDWPQNHVKDKLAKNELVLSMIVRLVRTVEIAGIARSAGFDALYVDLEHSSHSVDATGQICMAALALGLTPLVRVPSLAPEVIARVLDAGALGVIAPHIESAQDAMQVVRAAKYAPLGERSVAGNLPHFQFRSIPTALACEALNHATMVVVMIESAAALAAVDDIAAIDGVDLLLVGTNDLCASLGIAGQLDHALVRDAYSRCMDACRRNQKHLGIGGLGAHPKLAAEFIQLGARYISTGTDLAFLLNGATAKAKQMREL